MSFTFPPSCTARPAPHAGGVALRKLFLLPVRIYQRCVSPFLPPMCRYQPTCSHYMVEAVEKRGIVIGTLKGLWRLCRCHPLARGGWDPVDPDEPPPARQAAGPKARGPRARAFSSSPESLHG